MWSPPRVSLKGAAVPTLPTLPTFARAPAVGRASCHTLYRQDLVSPAVLRSETHPYSHLIEEEVEA